MAKFLRKLYRNWWVHNLIAHPLMQIVYFFSPRLADKIHDCTVPEEAYDNAPQSRR